MKVSVEFILEQYCIFTAYRNLDKWKLKTTLVAFDRLIDQELHRQYP
jgi:hypothetical protein